MLKLRYLLRFTGAFIYRFKGVIILSAIIGIVSFILISTLGNLFFGRTTERVGMSGRFHADSLPTFILEEIGDGLTLANEAGEIEPNLAASWETPDKGKTWYFYLKDDLVWHDGKKVDSASISYEFSDLEIERPDEKTLVFKLQNPFVPFPYVVSRPTFRQGLLGTGEWQVNRITVAGGYFQKIILTNGNKDRKIYKFYPTEERAKLAYKLGEVDTLLNIFNPSPFDTWKNTTIETEINTSKYTSIFFNNQDKFLGEKSLRQALAYAIDKNAFGGERAISPLSPTSWAFNPQVKPYTHDPDRAREMISELPNELKNELEIKLVTTSILLSEAEIIAKFWEEVGVNTVVQVSTGVPSDFQALLAILDIPRDPDQYSLWHSTQAGTNITRYQNPRIDKLLEDGREELNFEERRKIYLDFQRFLVEDSPAVFINHPTLYTIKRR